MGHHIFTIVVVTDHGIGINNRVIIMECLLVEKIAVAVFSFYAVLLDCWNFYIITSRIIVFQHQFHSCDYS